MAKTRDQGPAPAVTDGPAWAAATLGVLAALRPAHQTFVRAYVTGLSAAEALRRAAGRATPLDRRAAHRLKARPDVAAAVYQCLADPAYDAWMRRRIAAAGAPGRAGDTRQAGRVAPPGRTSAGGVRRLPRGARP